MTRMPVAPCLAQPHPQVDTPTLIWGADWQTTRGPLPWPAPPLIILPFLPTCPGWPPLEWAGWSPTVHKFMHLAFNELIIDTRHCTAQYTFI